MEIICIILRDISLPKKNASLAVVQACDVHIYGCHNFTVFHIIDEHTVYTSYIYNTFRFEVLTFLYQIPRGFVMSFPWLRIAPLRLFDFLPSPQAAFSANPIEQSNWANF